MIPGLTSALVYEEVKCRLHILNDVGRQGSAPPYLSLARWSDPQTRVGPPYLSLARWSDPQTRVGPPYLSLARWSDPQTRVGPPFWSLARWSDPQTEPVLCYHSVYVDDISLFCVWSPNIFLLDILQLPIPEIIYCHYTGDQARH
jgi:hypothetical protein